MRTPNAQRVSITSAMNSCLSLLVPTMHHSGSSMYICRREWESRAKDWRIRPRAAANLPHRRGAAFSPKHRAVHKMTSSLSPADRQCLYSSGRTM
eukprot:2268907-Heterocapsa_arctica.AAC.1